MVPIATALHTMHVGGLLCWSGWLIGTVTHSLGLAVGFHAHARDLSHHTGLERGIPVLKNVLGRFTASLFWAGAPERDESKLTSAAAGPAGHVTAHQAQPCLSSHSPSNIELCFHQALLIDLSD